MYTEQNRGFTVITNFGCDCRCKYCITKHHPILQNAVTDKDKIDWEYLEKCISESDAPTVNLSGGGDPHCGHGRRQPRRGRAGADAGRRHRRGRGRRQSGGAVRLPEHY